MRLPATRSKLPLKLPALDAPAKKAVGLMAASGLLAYYILRVLIYEMGTERYR
jgi:hypothetical protein